MRDLPIEIRTAYQQLEIRPVWFVRITMPDTTIYKYHSASGELYYLNTTWSGFGDLAAIGPITEEPGQREAGLDIAFVGFNRDTDLADYHPLVTATITGNYKGATVEIYHAVMSAHYQIISPNIGHLRYLGRLGNRTIRHEEQTIKITLHAYSEGALFDDTEGSMYAHEHHIAEHPNDHFFDQLPYLNGEMFINGRSVGGSGRWPKPLRG